MSYDIPPELKHKEKIMFGLTFSQLAYAFPTFLIIFLTIIKSGLAIEISASISFFIISVTVFFMFFEGKEKFFNLFKHLRNQQLEVNSESLKKIIDIKEIKGNIIKTSSGNLTILEVSPINFLIRTEEEKESIITSFQKFLNSLDFPLQIHISSTTINLDKHLVFVESKTSELKELFNSYKEFINTTIQENSIKNRKFYIILREKEKLEIQSQVVKDKLESVGLKVKRLKEKELLSLFKEYVAQNKDKQLEENQTIDNFAYFLASPQKIIFSHDHCKVDETFCKFIVVSGYPSSVELGFLDNIIRSSQNYDISIHIEPFPIEYTMIQLNRELQKQRADLYADTKKNIYNPSLEIKHTSTKQVLEDLQKGKQKLFNVSLYIMCKGKTLEEANLLTKKIKADLDGLMIQTKIPTFQMQSAYES